MALPLSTLLGGVGGRGVDDRVRMNGSGWRSCSSMTVDREIRWEHPPPARSPPAPIAPGGKSRPARSGSRRKSACMCVYAVINDYRGRQKRTSKSQNPLSTYLAEDPRRGVAVPVPVAVVVRRPRLRHLRHVAVPHEAIARPAGRIVHLIRGPRPMPRHHLHLQQPEPGRPLHQPLGERGDGHAVRVVAVGDGCGRW